MNLIELIIKTLLTVATSLIKIMWIELLNNQCQHHINNILIIYKKLPKALSNNNKNCPNSKKYKQKR